MPVSELNNKNIKKFHFKAQSLHIQYQPQQPTHNMSTIQPSTAPAKDDQKRGFFGSRYPGNEIAYYSKGIMQIIGNGGYSNKNKFIKEDFKIPSVSPKANSEL